jgi:hypothetical protein
MENILPAMKPKPFIACGRAVWKKVTGIDEKGMRVFARLTGHVSQIGFRAGAGLSPPTTEPED